VRYFGFLANRKRGSVLPKVYEALEMMLRKKPKKRWLRMPEPDQCA
ncbi:putative iSPsy3 transposase, partial [Candidatus Erwinia dacicola]